MAYIGKQPAIGNFVKLDAISVVNGQASYTMQNGGANFTEYSNVNQFLVSLNGILQSPTDSFTVSGSTITFASNLVTGDVIDFIIVLGNSLDVGVPSDNTVSLAKLTATGTKDATTFLRGDNTFAEVPAGGITEADQWRISASSPDSSGQDITSNWERSDSTAYGVLGTGMTESSGIFTFPSTGIYLVTVQAVAQARNGNMNQGEVYLKATTDNSTYNIVSQGENQCLTNNTAMITFCGLIDVTNTSNVKVKIATLVSGGTDMRLLGATTQTRTGITFVRLGDT
jgi:hypothetical protein